MNQPAIRIKKSFLLNDKIIPLLMPQLQEAGRTREAESEYIDSKVKDYREAWALYELRIIPALCDVLGVEFSQNIIDIYVAPFGNSFSDPMVISTKYSNERAVDVITHEICHRLLTDNNKVPMRDGRRLSEHWMQLFGDQDFRVLTHIPVHALLEYIFIDVLNEPERLVRDISFCSNHEPYKKAWNYVKEVGYMNVLRDLRMSYAS